MGTDENGNNPDEPPADRRRLGRQRMIRGAEIVFDGRSLAAAAFDVSETGVRVCLITPEKIPELVTLRLFDGTSHRVRRRWARRDELGFEFLAD